SRASTHRALTFRAARSRSATRGYVYVASTKVTLAPGRIGKGTLKCPARAPHPISGEFTSSSGEVVVTSSYATTTPGWHTQLTNLGQTKATSQIGAVCAPSP